MAWAAGPGNVTTLDIGGTAVDGGLVEGLSIATAPDTFSAANSIEVERGSVRKTLTANVLDVSTINAVNAFMTARTEQDITVTYSDATTTVLNNCIVRIKPIISPVTDVCNVEIAADGTTNSDIAANFTELGPVLGQPSFTADFPYDGVDGHGRPYFSSVRFNWEAILPGTSSILPYALLDTGVHRGVKNQIAFLMPDTNYVVFTDAYTYYTYADEDSSQPRAVRLRGSATGATWGAILGYSDGVVTTPTDEAWDAAGVTLRNDFFAGYELEVHGFHTAETTIQTHP